MYTYSHQGIFQEYDSYFTFVERGIPALGAPFMSNDTKSTFAAVSLKSTNSHAAMAFSGYINSEAKKLHARDSNFTVQLTGLPVFLQDSQDGIEQDMTKTDSGALVLSMSVLAYIIRSARLMVLPFLCIGCSIALSFTIMNFVATHGMNVISVTPSLMLSVRARCLLFLASLMSLRVPPFQRGFSRAVVQLNSLLLTVAPLIMCFRVVVGIAALFCLSFIRVLVLWQATLAMSVDYSLFLLTRYGEEVKRHKRVADTKVIAAMLRSSGHTVIVSGSTLAICFLGLCFFPIDMLRSCGLGAAIAIFSTVRSRRVLWLCWCARPCSE